MLKKVSPSQDSIMEYRAPDAASFDMSAEAIKKRDEQSKIKWDKLNVGIIYQGVAITLPAEPGPMPLEKAIEALQRKERDEYQPFQITEWIDAYPHDAAVAFVKAMGNLYGWASPQTVQTFFGPKPPTMLSVRTGYNIEDVVQCPLGAFKLPGVDELVNTGINRQGFYVNAEIKKKDRHVVLALISEARRIVKAESIYKGRAIRLGVDSDGDLDMGHPPEFMNVSDAVRGSVILDPDILEEIETNVLVPIEFTEHVKAQSIPLKRTCLFEGPFGTGKTLCARMIANIAEQNGWTFVLLNRVEGLKAALEFAKRYSPAVVFAEDIDRITSNRDDDMNDLILTIDGVVSKGVEIETILTTNNVKSIHKVMIRPGRLDAVISFRPPSDPTVQKLIRFYAPNLLQSGESLNGAGQVMAGAIPATIRECVERAKLSMIRRGATKINDNDLVVSARTMKNHMDLLKEEEKTETAAERLARSLVEVINSNEEGEPLHDAIDHIGGVVSNTYQRSSETVARVRNIEEILQELKKILSVTK